MLLGLGFVSDKVGVRSVGFNLCKFLEKSKFTIEIFLGGSDEEYFSNVCVDDGFYE